MDKLQKLQWAKLFLIAFMIILTPFLSTCMRTPYLFLLLHILIITLSAESGLLATLSMPQHDKKTSVATATLTVSATTVVAADTSPPKASGEEPGVGHEKGNGAGAKSVEKIVAVVKVRRVKKCPSRPSLFFIENDEGGEEEDEGKEEEDEHKMKEEENDIPSSQELFAKADAFISNFYKKLKIQREESWKRIHGFYHRAF